jgi:hypothetical protein
MEVAHALTLRELEERALQPDVTLTAAVADLLADEFVEFGARASSTSRRSSRLCATS